MELKSSHEEEYWHMTEKMIDPKVLSKVKKLLALANNAGATEGEAALAAERARAIMAENGITNATIEAAGGEGEARTKDSKRGHVGKVWMRHIMRALAKQSFVAVDWTEGGRRYVEEEHDWKVQPGHWDLFGRESAVVTVKLMHEYLVRTVDRVARERGTPTDEVFKEAMGNRIAERILERHEQAMEQQAREAREAKARAAHPSSASSGNALVVVLEDYAQKERDLNNDLMNGWPAGRTAENRRKREIEQAERDAENERIAEERRQERERLLAEGIDPEVVDLMLDGFSFERATAMVEEDRTPEAQAKRERERVRSEKEEQIWRERMKRRFERESAKYRSTSYREGTRAGDNVGLDAQVDAKETRRLK